MNHAILCNGPAFKLERWGYGLFYALTHKASGRSVFVQGADAAAFDAELLAAERDFPENTTDQNAAWLWNECGYEAAAVEIPQ